MHYRDARRAAAVPSVFGRVPARELYERTGIQLLPINTIFELAAMAAERRPGARGGCDAAPDPRPVPLLALRRARPPSSRTRRRPSATTRSPATGRPISWSGSTSPRRCFRRSSRRGRRSAPLSPDVAERDGTRPRAGDRGRDARHRLGRRGECRCADDASVFLSIGTWSLVGVEVDASRDRRRIVRGEPDERGWRGGNLPPAPQRHRPVAAATSAGASWAAEGTELGFDELVALAAAAPAVRRVRRPERRDVPRARRHAGAHSRVLPRDRTA